MRKFGNEKQFVLWIAFAVATPTGALGSGVLVPRDGSPPIAVRSHRVTAFVEDGLARTTVRQTFVNPHGRVLEAVYEFPLPQGAGLTDLALEVGGQRLEGFLAERQTARRTYDTLVRRRIDPALVEQVGRERFRLSVFPVVPDQPTIVELTWIEPVPLLNSEYRYVYPLALAGEASRTQQDFTISVAIRSSAPLQSVSSPSPDMSARKVSSTEGLASLERMGAVLSEDVVVVARVRSPEPTLAVHIYRPPQGQPYFAAVVTPPELSENQIVPRDVTLVLDVSGSMNGIKMEQARSAGLWLVDHLREMDRVNIILFNDVVQRFAEQPVAVTKESLEALRKFLGEASAAGGTALGDAIQAACKAPAQAGRAAMAVIMSDGLPTVGEVRPERIVSFAREGAEHGLAVHLFGVGPDVDDALLEGVAAAGGGQAEIFRPNGEIESRLRSFLVRTGSAAMVDLELLVDGRSVDDLLPRPLPNLYLGEQVVLTGRLPAEGKREVELRGILDGRRIVLRREANFDSAHSVEESVHPVKGQGKPIARDLYARAKLDFLERALRLRTGLKDAAYFTALDRGAYSTADELVAAVIDVSLDTGVQSTYTSFLALLPEDRLRLNPRDSAALEEALQRANARRRELAPVVAAESKWENETSGIDSTTSKLQGGGDTTPPGNPGGPATPGPGDAVKAGPPDAWEVDDSPGFFTGRGRKAPGTPPSSRSATTGGGPDVPGSTSGGSRSTTGAGSRRRGGAEGFERWEFWFEHNRDGLLRGSVIPSRAASRRPVPSASGMDLAAPAIVVRPTSDDVHQHIVPGLLHLLESPDPDLAAAAALSLARAAAAQDREAVTDALLKALGHSDHTVRESAVMGLGVLGTPAPRVLESLVALLLDAQAGRKLTGQSHVEDQVRALAAASLGLIGAKEAAEPLKAVIRSTSRRAAADVRAMAILALGMLGEQSAETARFLVELLDRGDLERIERAQVPIALARLHAAVPSGSEAVRNLLPDLVCRFGDDRTDVDVQRSLAIAFGVVANVNDTEVIEALQAAIKNHPDDPVRRFAIVALAQIGARDGARSAGEPAHARLRELFQRELTGSTRATGKAYGAIALGIYASAHRDQIEDAADRMLRAFKSSRNLSDQGAMASALEMLGGSKSLDTLRDHFERTDEPSLQIHLARALGELGSPAQLQSLGQLLAGPRLDDNAYLALACALARQGDRRALDQLLRAAQDPLHPGHWHAIEAVGAVRDRAAIQPLLHLASSADQPPLHRALACAALGRLADADARPWVMKFSENVNYRAQFPALAWILHEE